MEVDKPMNPALVSSALDTFVLMAENQLDINSRLSGLENKVEIVIGLVQTVLQQVSSVGSGGT